MRIILTLIFLFLSQSTLAWDGVASGKIKGIDIAPADNYAFRVSLSGTDGTLINQCGSHTWAYLNKASSNYEVFVSALLAAKMAQTNVAIYTSKESTSGNDYCHIGYISI